MANPRILAEAAKRLHTDDIKRLAAMVSRLPSHVTRVRAVVVCSAGNNRLGCGKRWERKLSLADREAPEAFQHLLKEARIHEALYEHRGCIDLTIEPL